MLPPDDMTALARLAGRAVAQTALSAAWPDMRRTVGRVLAGKGEQVGPLLDATRESIATSHAEFEQVMADQAALWADRFARVLATYPDAKPEVYEIVYLAFPIFRVKHMTAQKIIGNIKDTGAAPPPGPDLDDDDE